MQLSNFDPADFLGDYWQKKPYLIRNAWDRWKNPVEEDAIAGLSCENEVESRLIEQTADGLQLTHGPMATRRLQTLGPAPWTLLVQAVDQFIPEVAALIEPFRFVPDWRIDDVMVSLANDGGGVGPHFDQYDVFLIQGAGQRKWQIGQMCGEHSVLLPHDDLCLLADFHIAEEWLLEPGDMLYIPPGLAHNGIAVGDGCMTYSIGFRAPARSELIGQFSDHMLLTMTGDVRYSDPDLSLQDNSGEIAPAAVDRLHSMVLESMNDRAEFARWVGKFATMSKYPDIGWGPEHPLARPVLEGELARGHVLGRNPAIRFSYIHIDEGTLLLFVNGESYRCEAVSAQMAQRLCSDRIIKLSADDLADNAVMELIVTLHNLGALELVNRQ